MKTLTSVIIMLALLTATLRSQKLPGGYILQYQQNFSDSKALTDFRLSNAKAWGIFNSGGNFYLQFNVTDQSGQPAVVPENTGILKNHIFGDFILEADVMPEAGAGDLREVCLLLGYKDPSRYYCIQLASACDSLTHGIFLVNKSIPVKLTGMDEKPVSWSKNKWDHIRMERNIVKRTITVFINDMTRPVLQVKDYELVMGSIGFGSVFNPVRIDNIKIWAPTVIPEE
jgi:hypothetical protein